MMKWMEYTAPHSPGCRNSRSWESSAVSQKWDTIPLSFQECRSKAMTLQPKTHIFSPSMAWTCLSKSMCCNLSPQSDSVGRQGLMRGVLLRTGSHEGLMLLATEWINVEVWCWGDGRVSKVLALASMKDSSPNTYIKRWAWQHILVITGLGRWSEGQAEAGQSCLYSKF